MSKSKAKTRPFEQTAQQRAELDAFRRMLELSEGTFSLSVALCNSPALRDHLIEHITGEMEGIEVVRIPEDAYDIFDFVRQQVPNGQHRAVFVTDIEKTLAGDKKDRIVQGLNVSREQWRSACECPIVFWLPEYVISLLMTEARDLWSWVSHHFEFVSEQATASAGLQDYYGGNVTAAMNLDVHEKRFRIAELEQRIADAGDEPQGQLREHVSIWRNELAYLWRSLGNSDAAMALFEKEEEICRRLGDLDGLRTSLGSQALILRARGDLDGAMELHRQEEQISRQLDNLNGLQASLGNQALILELRGKLDDAMALLEEKEGICRRLSNLDGLQRALGGQANVLQAQGDPDGAMMRLKEQEQICRQLGSLDGLQRALGSQALVLQDRHDSDEAMALLKEQERICRQLGNLHCLQGCFGSQALILTGRGDIDGAMGLLKEQGRICRQLGNVEGLATSLANQALVLHRMGHAREALPLVEEAHQLATEHGYAALAKQIEPFLNAVRQAAEGPPGNEPKSSL